MPKKTEDSAKDRAKRFVYSDNEWQDSMLLDPKPLNLANVAKLKRKVGKKRE